jgi:hypothetical protein
VLIEVGPHPVPKTKWHNVTHHNLSHAGWREQAEQARRLHTELMARADSNDHQFVVWTERVPQLESVRMAHLYLRVEGDTVSVLKDRHGTCREV